MAAYAAGIRAGTKLRSVQAINSTVSRFTLIPKLPLPSSSSSQFDHSIGNRFDCRQISQLVQSNGKRLFLVDTLALVRIYLFI